MTSATLAPLPNFSDVSGALPGLVGTFYQRMLADPVLVHFFEGVDMDKQRDKMLAFLSSLFPGGPSYSGKGMKEAHDQLQIEPRHFERVGHHLEGVLLSGGLAPAVINTIMIEVAKFAPAVINRPCKRADLNAAIEPHREAVLLHPVYGAIRTVDHLRTFMEHHVYAVWDFMCLLKALQQIVTCVKQPWVPQGEPETRRLINEIVVGEESDDCNGRPLSHFELYVEAMEEVGADTSHVLRFIDLLREGHLVHVALREAGAPLAAREFVYGTFDVVSMGRAWAIASAFTLGREGLIPAMFRQVVAGLQTSMSGDSKLDTLLFYLDRHIGLDEEEHGPAADRMLENLCLNAPERWDESTGTAIKALRARHALWDAVHQKISS